MLKALEKSSTEKELQREQKNGMNDEVAGAAGEADVAGEVGAAGAENINNIAESKDAALEMKAHSQNGRTLGDPSNAEAISKCKEAAAEEVRLNGNTKYLRS